MRTNELNGKRVYIWGMGVEGAAITEFLVKRLPNLKPAVIENDVVPPDAEIVIKSPGVSIYKDEYKNASARGVKFTSLMNIFFAELYANARRPVVIAVTGTKGKTTTASMLAFMLTKLGKRAGLGGNIGTPPLDFLGQDLDYIVLELSSFQLTDLEYRPDMCQVVSISPAHLDWHLNYENYKKDKLRFLMDGKVKSFLCGYDDELKAMNIPNAEFYYKTTLSVPPLKVYGEHNVINMSGALAIVRALGLDEARALSFMPEFTPIEHRLEKVHEANGIIFINDSIATVAESAIAAIRAFAGRPIAIIVGGFDNKSANFGELSKVITDTGDVKIACGLPDTGRLVTSPKLRMVENMEQAVAAAIKALPNGGAVILSPAAQSFNMYKNYKERGHDFAKWAKSLS